MNPSLFDNQTTDKQLGIFSRAEASTLIPFNSADEDNTGASPAVNYTSVPETTQLNAIIKVLGMEYVGCGTAVPALIFSSCTHEHSSRSTQRLIKVTFLPLKVNKLPGCILSYRKLTNCAITMTPLDTVLED